MRSALLSEAEMNALLYSEVIQTEEIKLSSASNLYFPLDPIVINLADKGADRTAQVGITFQIREPKSADAVEKILPTLRNAILMTLSEKKSEDLLSRQGKEKLVTDILSEVGRVFGVTSEDSQTEEVKPSNFDTLPLQTQPTNPVLEVLFSSLIVQ